MALKIALAQMIPAWLNREETLSRVTARVKEAAAQGAIQRGEPGLGG